MSMLMFTARMLQEALWCTLDFFGKFYLRDRCVELLACHQSDQGET